MRDDLYEVLIERPRSGWRLKTRRAGKPRAMHWDGEDGYEDCVAPQPLRTKGFSDLISPLRRWLRSQLHRPWDKVYSELCAGIDSRTTVGQHLLDHARWEVASQCRIDECGAVWAHGRFWDERKVNGLYVHPRTGLLRWQELHWGKQAKARRSAMRAEAEEQLRHVDGNAFYLAKDGIWYRIEAEPMDYVNRRLPSGDFNWRNWPYRICIKKQMSRRELNAAGLENRPEY